MSKIELKPCPFCGGEAQLHTFVKSNWVPLRAMAYVKCTICNVATDNITDDKGDGSYILDAADTWNRRVTE